MCAVLISGQVRLPGKKQRLWVVGLWVPQCMVASKLVESQLPLMEGSKDPLPPTRKKKGPTRRGARSRSREARRHAQQAETVGNPKEIGSRRKVGGGSRWRHLVAGLERSVERAIPVAQQCLDIKRRAEERREKKGYVGNDGVWVRLEPLPPRARAGLERRQTRLRKSSDFWGKAYASASGCPPSVGRQYWRDLLFRKSLAQKRKGVLFEDSATIYSVDGISRLAEKMPVQAAGESEISVGEGHTLFAECGAKPSCPWYTWAHGPVVAEIESCPGCGGNVMTAVARRGQVPSGWHR